MLFYLADWNKSDERYTKLIMLFKFEMHIWGIIAMVSCLIMMSLYIVVVLYVVNYWGNQIPNGDSSKNTYKILFCIFFLNKNATRVLLCCVK